MKYYALGDAGHSSVPHSRIQLGNRNCTYQGPSTYTTSRYEVVLPVGGKIRYWGGSMPIVVCRPPQPPSPLAQPSPFFTRRLDVR